MKAHRLTDIFIHRPVLSVVISLLILVLGLRSINLLPVRQYPFTQNAVVTVTTTFTGASPDVIAGFITTPLETSIAQAEGIDYLTSTSIQSTSTINAHLKLNYDPNKALTEINTKVNAVLNKLPQESQIPVLTIEVGETISSMYIGFYSHILPSNQVTDYLIRVVQPKLQAVEGVQLAEVLGTGQFAMRAWVDPMKLAAYNLTAAEISTALVANDFISAPGRTKGDMITVNFTAETGLHSIEQFKNLIVKSVNGAIIRLKDVATVVLGSESYDSSVLFDAASAVYIGIKVAPAANLLSVIDSVKKVFPTIEAQLPEGLKARIAYDATKYVHSAIAEVEHSLIEALIIVTGVIFIFLGSFRSVLIPLVAIPLSLIGTFFMMLILGYSINLLTLLALVLAIGLVVDDAIIVVENIHRHIEEGVSPFNAAIQGARELANPIIAISVVLIAVYIPIGFMSGLTGALFTEFAFTLAGAVGISAVIALTLSPMMCAKLLEENQSQTRGRRFMLWVDEQFEKLRMTYRRSLNHSLNYLSVTAVFAAIILVSIYFLYTTSKSELAPQEDQGIIIASMQTAPNATLKHTELYSKIIDKYFDQIPEKDHTFQLNGYDGLNSSITGLVLKPWDERDRTSNELQPYVQQLMNKIPGGQIAVFQLPPLPGAGGGLPMEFVIQTTESYDKLFDLTNNIINKANETGQFLYLDSDLKIDKLQTTIQFDRDKASQLGLTMAQVGNVLGSILGGNYVNYFSLDGRSYKVIPQVLRKDRLNYDQILNYYITTQDGKSVPFSTFTSLKNSVVPQSLNHFQQLNAAIISGVLAPGVSLGEALATMQNLAKQQLPREYSVDYAGQSRQFIQESSALIITFFFALVIIYLTLAALFESFVDPLIVLITVPMSVYGAMIFISIGLGGASLNIYTEVGLVTLIGLISKHGILIVQFANDLQLEGKDKREAIEEAASIRLRPILMTTAAMVLGVVPLILATGAGALSRYNIGLVIAAGISIGTLFTLFVVPAMYLLMAKKLTPASTLVS